MVSSPSLSHTMKHFHRLSNGRNFSFNVDSDSEEIPLSESFVHLAKMTSNRSEDHLKHLVSKSLQGLRCGFSPRLCESGVGGTYFMHDEDNKTVGVFKPHDEEMGCMNNPKGFTPKTPSFIEFNNVYRGAEAGEAAFRECAAYILDHEHFSGVPATGLVVCNHPSFTTDSFTDQFKIGSFQEFKEHDFDAEDISSTKYQQFPVHEVHKIAILDIRLLNTDRHGGNILVKANRSRTNSREDVLSDGYDSTDDMRRRGYSDASENGMMFRMDIDEDEDDDEEYGYKEESYGNAQSPTIEYELIPIDHGYTLPSTISGLSDLWFEWLKWPQAKIPFGVEELQYIERLNSDEDIAILKVKFGDLISSECFKVLRITTMWLKIAAKVGLTAYSIGYALCRKGSDTMSPLETMSMEAQVLADQLSISHPPGPSPSLRDLHDLSDLSHLSDVSDMSDLNNLSGLADLNELNKLNEMKDAHYFEQLALVMQRTALAIKDAPVSSSFARRY